MLEKCRGMGATYPRINDEEPKPLLAVTMQLKKAVPLTLPSPKWLPKGEGPSSARLDNSLNGEIVRTRQSVLPLPRGEGWVRGNYFSTA